MSEQIGVNHKLEAVAFEARKFIPGFVVGSDISVQNASYARASWAFHGTEQTNIVGVGALVKSPDDIPPVDELIIRRYLADYNAGLDGPYTPFGIKAIPKKYWSSDVFAVDSPVGPVVFAVTEMQKYQDCMLPSNAEAGLLGYKEHHTTVSRGTRDLSMIVQMDTDDIVFNGGVYDPDVSLRDGGWHVERHEYGKKQEIDWQLMLELGERGIPVPVLTLGHNYFDKEIVTLSRYIETGMPVHQTILLPEGSRISKKITFGDLIERYYSPEATDYPPFVSKGDLRSGKYHWAGLHVWDKYFHDAVTPANVHDVAFLVNPNSLNCYLKVIRQATPQEVEEYNRKQLNKQVLQRIDLVTSSRSRV